MSFPSFQFTFTVFNVKRPVLKPRDVLFIFLPKPTGVLSAFTQKERKSAKKRADVWLSPSSNVINYFTIKVLKLLSTSKHPKETTFNQ